VYRLKVGVGASLGGELGQLDRQRLAGVEDIR
jgi:hypothetical protein